MARKIIYISIIVIGLLILFQLKSVFPLNDYIEYWSATQLLLNRGNPYNAQELLTIQQTVGWQQPQALMMWNPPWVLSYILPFALFSYSSSRMLFFLSSLALVLYSANQLWAFLGGDPKGVWIAWIAAFSLGPLIQTLWYGQVTVLSLAGIALFLMFANRQQWLLAGLSASLVFVKPHTIYLFAIALILWTIYSRRWQILWGIGAGLGFAGLVAWLIQPAIIQQYFQGWQSLPPEGWLTATPGSALRVALGWEKTWLQYLPSAIGLAWFLIYWTRHKEGWDWRKQAPLIMLVSFATSAYGWVFDPIIILPAVIEVVIQTNLRALNFMRIFGIAAYCLVNLLLIFPRFLPNMTQDQLWWLGGFFLLCYLLLIPGRATITRTPEHLPG